VDIPELVRRMGREGYAITEDEYRAIEDGSALPDDPRRFLDVVTLCLGLGRVEFEDLLLALARAIIEDDLGDWDDPALHM
jgi:hypothetical protein